MKIAVLPGDGIGTEIVAEAVNVLKALDLKIEMKTALVGGAAYEAFGHPLLNPHFNWPRMLTRFSLARRRLEVRQAGPPAAS